MSKVKSIVKEPEEETTPSPIFEPFKYHNEELDNLGVNIPASPMMRFLGRTSDIASGVATILEIKKHDEAEGFLEKPQVLLRPCDNGNLANLSIAALELLRDEAEELTEWAYKYHTPEGRAEHNISDLGL